MGAINYVIAAWSGERRDGSQLFHLQKQIRHLASLKHNLSQVTIVAPHNPKEPKSFTAYLEFIENASGFVKCPVKILQRPNIGMSYGCYSHAYDTFGNDFDYYIFVEDDYYFIRDDFDTILVTMFNEGAGCSYLCGFISKIPGKQWMGNTVGITSSATLDQIKQKYGHIPFDASCVDGKYTKESGQVTFSDAFHAVGKGLRDITSQYLCLHWYWQHQKCNPIPGQPPNKRCLFVPTQLADATSYF